MTNETESILGSMIGTILATEIGLPGADPDPLPEPGR